MQRALIALFLTPLLASAPFGVFAFFAIPFMLIVTLTIAFPLFLLLRKANRLDWWHALLAGAFCGACVVAVNFLFQQGTDIDRLLTSTNVVFIELGAGIGFGFWWLGIFRNPAFPFVKRGIPVGALIILPVVAALGLAQQSLKSTSHTGRVIKVLKEPGPKLHQGQVSVRLSANTTVQADLSNTWAGSTIEGTCFHLEERWSTLRFRRVYQLISPFGGGINDC